MWNDETVGIQWPRLETMDILLSDKDKVNPGLRDLDV